MSIPTQEIPVASVFQGIRLHGSTVARTPNPRKDLTLAGATLVFYAAGRAERGGVARTAWGYRKVAADSVDTPEIGRAVVGDDGSYHAALKEAAELVLVAIDVEKFSYAPATGKRAFGVLGVAAPSWDGRSAALNVVLPPKAYCGILTALDLWLVCGTVTDCGDGKAAVGGVAVSAFDRDLSQDDVLGSAPTDAGGNFDIFFPGAQFKKIPVLPPPFDSIAPFELFGGPDVYFRVDAGAVNLLDEDASLGRTPGRENVDHCSFHALCVSPPKPEVHTTTLWTHIGYLRVPNGSVLNDFDADGFVASGTLALTGSLAFRGEIAQVMGGDPVSYRFEYAEWPDLSTPPIEAAFHPLTAANLELGQPYGYIVTPADTDGDGTIHYWEHTDTAMYPAPDADGWIAVTTDPEFRQLGQPLAVVNSASLVPEVASPGELDSRVNPGQAVEIADVPRKFSFRLQVRHGASTDTAIPVPVHLNNSWAYLRYDLQELMANSCGTVPLQGDDNITVHPAYSIAHPYLGSYDITVERQDGPVVHAAHDSYANHGGMWTPAAGIVGTAAQVYGGGGHCSYRCWWRVGRRLTDGVNGAAAQERLRTFCVA